MPDNANGSPGCLAIVAVFMLLVTPVYLVFRYFVGLVRMAYGFTPAEEGPVPRVCPGCHNTVLEDDFRHCPYCGRDLEEPQPESHSVADDSDGPV